MNKKIKIIDLLCLISNGEEVPKRIKSEGHYYNYNELEKDYYEGTGYDYEYLLKNTSTDSLNDEIEILDEEDKDIPLIPDDELYDMENIDDFSKSYKYLAYNFKVLKEKINQVVEELNKRQ